MRAMMQPAHANKKSFIIRALQPSDIPAVSELAAHIWRAHYPSIISHEQINYMLELMYSPAALTRDLADGKYFWLAYDGNKLIGYASVEENKQNDCFLHKLYVDPDCHGSGAGSALMRHIDQALAPKTLALHVNRANIKAINFYFKHGFVIERLQSTDIGNGFVMDDFRMQRS